MATTDYFVYWTDNGTTSYSTNTTVTCSRNNTIWRNWNITYDSGTTGATTADHFTYWTDTSYTTDATEKVWVEWNEEPTSAEAPQRVVISPEVIERQRERDRQIREEYQARVKAEEEKNLKAEEKAKILLKEHLDQVQSEMFEKHGYIPVITPSGEVYRIEPNGYVHKLDKEGKVIEGLCVVPYPDRDLKRNYPLSDQKLMKKLMLENCEDIFRQTANIHRFTN